jgi:hypothetical protein
VDNNEFFVVTFVGEDSGTQIEKKQIAFPFNAIAQIIGIDRSAFIVVDEQKKAYVVTMSELSNPNRTIMEVPLSQEAILVPELDVNHDFVDSSVTPRLFLAKSNGDGSDVHQWSLPKQPNYVEDRNSGEDEASSVIATIACQRVTGGISTPLGPWWYVWAQTEPQNMYTLCVYNLDDWLEWDEKGMRADVRINVRVAANALQSGDDASPSASAPFDLRCQISRGHTLAMTHVAKTPGDKDSYSPAWPRQAQGQYTAFAVPSHASQSQPYWSRGFIVLWPELLQVDDKDAIYMAGAWFRERWQQKQLLIKSDETPVEVPGWSCIIEGTLHILEVDWWQNLGQAKPWKRDITITGCLHPVEPAQSNWSLQLHEQAWEWDPRKIPDAPILGLLILKQNADSEVQLPVCLQPSSPLEITGYRPELYIKPGLYSVDKVVSCLPSTELTDLTLPKQAGDSEMSYDICPVTLDAQNIWCRLTPDTNGNLVLMSVGLDDMFPFLAMEAKSELPKQPVARTQLTHRRVFGARLRFGSNVEPFQPNVCNAWNVIGRVYDYLEDNGSVNGTSGNPDNLYTISGFLINKEGAHAKFLPKNRADIWNVQRRSVYPDDPSPDWSDINPGDQFFAWTPNENDTTGERPSPNKIALERGNYVGALTAQSAGNIWMFQEPFWVAPSENTDKTYRTENVLVVSRSETTSAPAVCCLRSVTDVVGASVDRGLDSETLWSFLLECGVSGLVIQRLFQASGPPVYRFSRSPFSIPAGEFHSGIQTNQTTSNQPRPGGAIPPILLQGQPWSTASLAAHYVPMLEPSTAPLPILSRDYRHVSVQLRPVGNTLNRPNTFSSLLLQESVCYDDQALNDPSSQRTVTTPATDKLPPLRSSFHPLALDLVYSTDKPGAMLSHSLDLLRVNEDQRECGLRTMFAMRDPRQVKLPPGAQLRINEVRRVNNNTITLQFEEVLGSLPGPAKPVDQLITKDSSNQYVINQDVLLLFTVVGDEVIQLTKNSPYLPVEQAQSKQPCLYLVSKGELTNPYIILEGSPPIEFSLDELISPPVQNGKKDDYWWIEIPVDLKKPNFQLSWREKGENSDYRPLNYFSQNLQIRLIPAMATPKLGIATCGAKAQNLDLFAPAKGGNAAINLISSDQSALIEVSNSYSVTWHSQMDDIDEVHVIKYFSDGQTLCAYSQIPRS